MELRFEPVNEQNRKEVANLRVAEGQESFIETVEDCLKEAEEYSCWRPVGIFDGDILIGFAMYCQWNNDPKERVWLDRYLIDARYQGKGYGRACLELLLKKLREEYGCGKIYLSVIPGNSRAERLYREYGFAYNGEKDIHGEHVMERSCSAEP